MWNVKCEMLAMTVQQMEHAPFANKTVIAVVCVLIFFLFISSFFYFLLANNKR